MKTVKQWLEELPEPIRTQAFENNRLQGKENVLESIEQSMQSALFISHSWVSSQEGYSFWSKILFPNIYNKEPKTIIQKVEQDLLERFKKLLTKNIFVEVKPIDDWNNWTWLILAEDAMSPICIIEKANPEKVYISYFEAMESGINCAETL